MEICVIYPNACKESALYLAEAIGADVSNPYEANRRDYREYDVVFNYGCNRDIYAKKVINKSINVGQCIDKRVTFKIMKEAGVCHPAFWFRKEQVPEDVGIVVCREKASGARAEGMTYCYQNIGQKLPQGALYTAYFDYEFEYRIVVFNGEIVGRYHKKPVKDNWEFVLLQKKGFKAMDEECLTAAKALGIDYVGFDVVENADGQFVILEANSGPIITDESVKTIKKYFKTI